MTEAPPSTQTTIDRNRSDASGHIPALDGLRGLAILLVLCHHFTWPAAPLVSRLISSTMHFGWVGVDLFFVLSGFLITGILLDAKGTPHYLRNFYARRVFRIFPLYYGTLIVVFGLVAFGMLKGAGFVAASDHQGWFWTYTVNILVSRFGWDESGVPLSHFWSLAVEEHFYLIWPLLVLLLNRRELMWVCGGCIVGALILRIVLTSAMVHDRFAMGVYVLTPCRVDALAMGGLLAVLVRGPAGVGGLLKAARWIALGAGIPLLLIFLGKHAYVQPTGAGLRLVPTFGYTLLALFFGAVLIFCLDRSSTGVLTRVMTHPALRFLGKYSYGLYVFHYVFKGAFDHWFAPPILAPYVGFIPALALYFIVSSGLSLGVALLSWNLFEKHFLKLKRFFEYRNPNAKSTSTRRVLATTPA